MKRHDTESRWSPKDDWICGVVCGYAPPYRQRHRMLMLEAYIDDSKAFSGVEKGATERVLILGGYISEARSWDEFSLNWQEELDRDGIKEFKMTDRRNLPIEENERYYRLIEDHAQASIVCAVDIPALIRVCAELDIGYRTVAPYWLAVKALIDVTAQEQSDLGLKEPIDFIFDKDGQERKIEEAWSVYTNSLPDEFYRRLGARPRWDLSHIAKPLQSADLGVWWYRKQFVETGKIDGLTFPWAIKKDLRRLLITYDEAAIREELFAARVRNFRLDFHLSEVA